jgi:hypothetical protein
MTAATKFFDAPAYNPSIFREYGVKAGEKLIQGTMAGLLNGYLVDVTAVDTLTIVGRVEETVDNTDGQDGDVRCKVQTGVFRYANGAAITKASIGALAYAADNATIATNGAGKSIAGTIEDVDDLGVWVGMGFGPPFDASVLTAFIANLAATSAAEGASLVGIEDAGGFYAGATVEAAMQELIGGKRIATLADAALTPGILMVQTFAIADAATGNLDSVLARKQEIIDCVVQKRGALGGAGDTIQLQVGAGTAITDAISLNVADKAIARAASIDDAQSTINAAGTLRIHWNKVTNVACLVTVYSVLRA